MSPRGAMGENVMCSLCLCWTLLHHCSRLFPELLGGEFFQRQAIALRANKAIKALNSLYFGTDEVGGVRTVRDLSGLTLCQSDCLKNILSHVKHLGAPPEGASCQAPLQALRTAGNSYEEPEPGVGSVVAMQMERLSLPSGKAAGVSMVDELTGDVGDMVRNYENYMLQDASAWTDLEAEAAKLTPYDDPLLKSKEGYRAFLKHLFDCGVLSFTPHCRGRVGAFCVSKKPKFIDGVKIDRQRLVLDCRAVNLAFREPPRTRLGSLASVTEAFLPSDQQLFVATADICDCFYACDCPPGMEQYFCLREDVSLAEAESITGGLLDLSMYSDYDSLSPCIKVLPMGFNWSFYLVQVLHEQATVQALSCNTSALFLDGAPPPDLTDDACVGMPYCDNVHVMSCSSQLCQEGKDRVAKSLENMGFVLHEHTGANTLTQTLGGIIDGDLGVVRCTDKRIWSLILAFEYIAFHKVSVELVQRLLGHAMVACVINRSGMSVFRRLYDFVHSGSRSRRLHRHERRECLFFSGILPLLTANLRREWSSTLPSTDASPEGWGICERELSSAAIQKLGKWQERWRFRRLAPSEWKPRERAFRGLDPFSDIRTVVGSTQFCDELDNYTTNETFPEIPLSWLDPEHWKTVGLGKWKHTKEHITLKEGRALLLAVRRLSRAQKHRGHRHLILVDNMALCFAANKGRASNFGILRVLQQIGSVALASGLTIRTRWIPSEFNCADGPSRGQVCAGPFRQEDSKSVKVTSTYPGCSDIDNSGGEERRTHVGLSRGQEAVQGGFKSCGAGSRHDAYESSQNKEVDPCLESGEFCSSRRAGSEEPADGFGGEEHQCRGAESIRHVLREVSGLLQGQHDRLSGAGRKDRCSAGRLYGSSLSSGAKPARGRENSSFRRVQQHRSEGKAHEVKKGFERLEEGNACSKQVSSSQTDHVRHLRGAGGKRSFEHGAQGHHRFHPLFAAWRRVGHSGTKRGGTCEVSRSSIQMDHSDNSRSRRASTRQGGSLRQFDSHRPEGGAMGRKRVVENEETAFTRRQDLRVHHEDFRGKFAQAGANLGIENLHPYQLRHGGATEDLTSKRRDHPQVKARGRWMTDQSVRRYTKIGRVQALLNKLSPANLRFCQWSEKHLQAVIQGQKPARSASSQ